MLTSNKIKFIMLLINKKEEEEEEKNDNFTYNFSSPTY